MKARLLLGLFLSVLVICIYDFSAHVLPDFSAVKNVSFKGAPVNQNSPHIAKPLDYYTQDVEKKGLFRYSAASGLKTQGPSGQFQPAKAMFEELVQPLVLKGIIAREMLQAVIEDTKNAKTYFVVKNDKIGDIIVDDITPNKVRLKMDEQTTDLSL